MAIRTRKQADPLQCERFFSYNQEDLAGLMARDRELAKTIETIGPIKRRIYPDPFSALLRAIIGQQISSKAQDAIWSRFLDMFKPLNARKIAAVEPERLKTCGTSLRKAKYMQGIAKAFASGLLDSAQMANMEDDRLASLLTQLPGVGKWTAEMLLIFTFQRPNVLSFGDLAIRRGMMRLYGHETITPEIFKMHKQCYSPNATLAGMYLWEVASQTL